MPNITITVNAPSKTAPGFARRLRKSAAFQAKVSSGEITPELLDELVSFLADYCDGDDKEAVKEALWDLSEEQFTEILSAVSGGGAQVPPVN